MPRKNGSLDFEGIMADGENPKGFVAQTPVGTRVIPDGKIKIWENGPDYPPLPGEPYEWGRRPLYKLKVSRDEDTRKR
jgi:hypothetical protein